MKFSQYKLYPEIKRGLEELGFKRPTDIQYKSISAILKKEDVLAIAQTGTGKTAAFAIPVLHRVMELKKERKATGIQCVVMVPTRELAIQITEVFTTIGRYTKVKSFGIYGGVEQDRQIAKLEEGIDVLVATPGRMFDLIYQKKINLNATSMLVLDEADHMLELGFLKDIQDVIKFLPKWRQTLFFSATINERIKKLAYSLVTNAIRIQISPKNPVSKNVEHFLTHIEMDDKRFFLERLVNENPESKILVFVRTQVRAERVAKAMGRVNIYAETIHGGKEQKDRLEVLERFRSGKTMVLIATDISARGIDIPGVNFVVNYDLPENAENYVHRVGRTGRGTQKGKAVSFCSTEEKPMLQEIETFLGKPIEPLAISKKDYVETIDFSEEEIGDWKAVMKEIAQGAPKGKKKKKKKK